VLSAVALAGCGSSTAPRAPTAQGSAGGHFLVAALGDSITAGSPLWDPRAPVRRDIAPAPNRRSQYEYWAAKALRGVRFRNCGVFGETTDDIAKRLPACARGADALVVQGGVNDIAQSLGGSAERGAVEGAARNLDAMVREGKRMGLEVLVANLLPWNNGHPQADRWISRLNRAIARIGEREGVPVLPFHSTLEAPPGSGLMRSDLTIEGDHPSIAGYALLGQRAVAPALRPLVRGRDGTGQVGG